MSTNHTFENISKYFNLDIWRAASELGICETLLKRRCREIGIKKWPRRKIRSLERIIACIKLEMSECTNLREKKNHETEILEYEEKLKRLYLDPNIPMSELAPKAVLQKISKKMLKIKKDELFFPPAPVPTTEKDQDTTPLFPIYNFDEDQTVTAPPPPAQKIQPLKPKIEHITAPPSQKVQSLKSRLPKTNIKHFQHKTPSFSKSPRTILPAPFKLSIENTSVTEVDKIDIFKPQILFPVGNFIDSHTFPIKKRILTNYYTITPQPIKRKFEDAQFIEMRNSLPEIKYQKIW